MVTLVRVISPALLTLPLKPSNPPGSALVPEHSFVTVIAGLAGQTWQTVVKVLLTMNPVWSAPTATTVLVRGPHPFPGGVSLP
jgi:hypothetical protein